MKSFRQYLLLWGAIVLFGNSYALSQNLVIDPSFEDYKKVPCDFTRVADPFEDFVQKGNLLMAR